MKVFPGAFGAIVLSLFVCLFFSTASAQEFQFVDDIEVVMDANGIDLLILAGSEADSVAIDVDEITVTVLAGETFTIRAPNGNRMDNDGGYATCAPSGTPTLTISGPDTVLITPSTTICPTGGGGGGGGGGGSSTGTPTVPVIIAALTPETVPIGATATVTWSVGGAGVSHVRLWHETPEGKQLVADALPTNGTFVWSPPNEAQGTVPLILEALDTGTSVLASSVVTAVVVPVPAAAGPASAAPAPADPTATGTYSPAVAAASTLNISVDKSLPSAENPRCIPHSLIRASLSTVYYCGTDGKRYPFPNEKTFFTWYPDFSSVVRITDAQLAAIPLMENVSYRPGANMIKVQSDPRTYVVSRGGLLRWVESEGVARSLYGPNWSKSVHDVPDVFFANYLIGPSIIDLSPGTPAPSPAPAPPAPLPTTTPSPSCARAITFTQFLEIGSDDAQVLPLQQLLQCLGYIASSVTLTGHFGPATEQAVKDFQAAKGIDPAGYVGPATRAALNAYPLK